MNQRLELNIKTPTYKDFPGGVSIYCHTWESFYALVERDRLNALVREYEDRHQIKIYRPNMQCLTIQVSSYQDL